MGKNNKKLNLDKDILYDLYINQQHTSKEIANLYNCSSKSIRNYLTKYNIPVRQLSEAIKLERSKWSDEKEANRSKKFIQTWVDTPENIKKEIIRRRTKNANSPEAIEKSKITKQLNGTFKKSKAEDDFYRQLCLFFNYSDIVRGYVDEQRYPFNCDFYIKSKDLFIEYQGHQTHGNWPYDSNNAQHIDYCNCLKSSGYDTSTFTKRDPNKLNIAKHNNLNLILIYPRNDSYFVHNGIITSIGKFNITKINDLC